MHKICAPNASCECWTQAVFYAHAVWRGNCARIRSSYTTSLGPFQNDLALTCLFVSYEGQSSTTWEFVRSLIPCVFSFLSSSGRTCPWPLPPGENSVVRLLSPTHSFSTLLEVRCKRGFTLPSGLDVTIRRCQGDRQWSGDEPICTGGFVFTRKTLTSLMLFPCSFMTKNSGNSQYTSGGVSQRLMLYVLLSQTEYCLLLNRGSRYHPAVLYVHAFRSQIKCSFITIYFFVYFLIT